MGAATVKYMQRLAQLSTCSMQLAYRLKEGYIVMGIMLGISFTWCSGRCSNLVWLERNAQVSDLHMRVDDTAPGDP